MSRRTRRQRAQMTAIDQINMTPLLDLTFLLLIVFMITMPLLQYGTGVELPELNAGKLPEENFKTVTLTSKREYKYNDRTMTAGELQETLQLLMKNAPKTTVLVMADGKVNYSEVMTLLKLIKDSGFENASLVTNAESGK
ncbi:MAG: biopolymer transporter ExbD [Victivallaceae bacterium]|nr:biopolymer transporter ExbD [Victivallaceae bacterium]